MHRFERGNCIGVLFVRSAGPDGRIMQFVVSLWHFIEQVAWMVFMAGDEAVGPGGEGERCRVKGADGCGSAVEQMRGKSWNHERGFFEGWRRF